MYETSLKQIEMSEDKNWEISETKDGVTKRIKVEKAENGFIICKSKYGQVGEKYIDESKKYISTKNPLDKKEEEVKTPMSREELYSFLDGSIV